MARPTSKIFILCVLLFSGLVSLQAEEVLTINSHFDDLFLTPGGLYTKEDILANGAMTPYQRYQGLKAPLNATAKIGELICPITELKAHAKYAWIIGGKAYLFCSTSCIAKFLRTAKEKPEAILEPQQYVKK